MALNVNQLIGFGVVTSASASAPATISNTDSAVDSADLSTYTFSSKAIGTAAADRLIVIGTGFMSDTSGVTVSSLTVGGVSATSVVSAGTTTGGAGRAEMWIAAVPTGTTADVVVNLSGTCLGCGVGVFAIGGAQAAATHTQTSTSTSAPSGNLNISAGGVAVGYAFLQGNAPTSTWTNLTEGFDASVFGNQKHSGASDAFASAQSGLTITDTLSVSSSTTAFLLASFAP